MAGGEEDDAEDESLKFVSQVRLTVVGARYNHFYVRLEFYKSKLLRPEAEAKVGHGLIFGVCPAKAPARGNACVEAPTEEETLERNTRNAALGGSEAAGVTSAAGEDGGSSARSSPSPFVQFPREVGSALVASSSGTGSWSFQAFIKLKGAQISDKTSMQPIFAHDLFHQTEHLVKANEKSQSEIDVLNKTIVDAKEQIEYLQGKADGLKEAADADRAYQTRFAVELKQKQNADVEAGCEVPLQGFRTITECDFHLDVARYV